MHIQRLGWLISFFISATLSKLLKSVQRYPCTYLVRSVCLSQVMLIFLVLLDILSANVFISALSTKHNLHQSKYIFRLSKLCHAKASCRKTGIQQIKVSYSHVEIRSFLLYGIKIERDRMRVWRDIRSLRRRWQQGRS